MPISGFYTLLCVECFVFFQGSGVVVVIDVTEWEYETHMRHAKDRVVCVEHAYLVLFWTHCVVCYMPFP